jgi:hypothetical protein
VESRLISGSAATHIVYRVGANPLGFERIGWFPLFAREHTCFDLVEDARASSSSNEERLSPAVVGGFAGPSGREDDRVGREGFGTGLLMAGKPLCSRSFARCTRVSRGSSFGWLKKQSGVLGRNTAHTGAVTFVQRFGGSLNLHVHFHAVVLDGVYFESRPGAEPIFLGVRGPTDAELSELSAKLEGRVTRWLRKKGLLLAERQSAQAEPDALEQATQTALRLGQLAHVDELGQVVSPPARRPGRRTGTGAHAGYSLHASTVVAAGDREWLERLLRYCARPALSLERLRETKDGRYAYELKYPSLGRTHLVLTPTELLARLSLLVAPPRYPLVRYGGLFAPAHGLRKAIVSRAPGPPRAEGCCPERGGRRGAAGEDGEGGERGADAQSEPEGCRCRPRGGAARRGGGGRGDRDDRGPEARRAARRGDAQAVAR